LVKIIPFLKAFEGCGEAFLEKFPTRVSPRIPLPINCNLKEKNNDKSRICKT